MVFEPSPRLRADASTQPKGLLSLFRGSPNHLLLLDPQPSPGVQFSRFQGAGRFRVNTSMSRTGHIPSANRAAASLQAGAGSAVSGYGHIKGEAMLEA